MQALKERILAEGENLGNGILKIDSFLNHQLDPVLMMKMGKVVAERFRDVHIDRILTAETSGIAPALTTAMVLGVPVVYARKKKPITMAGPVYLETAPTHTKGGENVNLLVSAEFLRTGEHVLILDDFLATGETLLAMARIVRAARSSVVGFAVVVEKSFEKGREALGVAGFGNQGSPIHALATISRMDDGEIILA